MKKSPASMICVMVLGLLVLTGCSADGNLSITIDPFTMLSTILKQLQKPVGRQQTVITLTGKPHFVEFKAEWCGPCRQMKPTVNAMKTKYGDKITFWSVDIDDLASKTLIRKYNVGPVPYMVLLDKNGTMIGALESYQEPDELENALKDLIVSGG